MEHLLTDPNAWLGLVTLAALEIVLGIDNIVFIAILADRVKKSQVALAYRLGLIGAMLTRIGLLLTISWIMHLHGELFTLFDHAFSGRDLILLAGGLFLIAKSAHEIFEKVEALDEGEESEGKKPRASSSLLRVVIEISVMDIIFSIDSVITAVGMVDEVVIMITAIVLAIAVMMLFAKKIGDFVNDNPSMKILALSFLLLIGVLLTADAMGQHISKGYIYFAMAFSLVVELLNMRHQRTHERRMKKKAASAESGSIENPEG